MFARKERIPRALFTAAQAKGRRISSANFTVVVPIEGQGYAVVVSKKIAQLSVTRHRIKRRVLAALRTLPLPQSLIVYPKASMLTVDFGGMKAELAGLISKASENGHVGRK